MRAVFGVVALMVVVGLVGMLAGRQLKAMRGIPMSAEVASVPANVREQSQQIQAKVVNDVAKAMEQASAHKDDAEK